MPRAVLFDMDGTLIDTEPWWYQSEKDFCRAHGVRWSAEDAQGAIGSSLAHTAGLLKAKTGSELPVQQIMDSLLDTMCHRLATEQVQWQPGIPELIDRLRNNGVKVGLVTSSFRRMVDPFLSGLDQRFFDVVVTGSDVVNAKPHPEPYLSAIDQLKVRPSETVILEDSRTGIESGKKSGAHVVSVPCVSPVPAVDGVSRVASAEQLTDAVLVRIVGGEQIDLLGTGPIVV